MRKKLLGIINVDFGTTGHLLIIHSAFTKDFKKAYDPERSKVLYNILTEFGIPMKLVRLIKMCLNETYSTVWVGKNFSDMFPIKNGLKQGDAFFITGSQLCFTVCHKRVQVNQVGLKLNDTHQLSVVVDDDDDDDTMGGSVHTIQKNLEALVAASKETGLEENADKTKCMVKSRDPNAE